MSLLLSADSLSPDVLRFHTRNLIAFLVLFCFFLVVASIVGNVLQYEYTMNNNTVRRYVDFFDLNHENNLPTPYSTMLLLAASPLNFLIFSLSFIRIETKKFRFYWLALAFIFLFLCFDESLQIHEKVNGADAMQKVATESSLFYYAWVVPYSIGLLLIGLLFLRFLFNLPAATRNQFIIAGIIYVTGALGLEFFESYIHVHLGKDSIWERVFWTAEEAMEMIGVILFINALLRYIASLQIKFQVQRS